MRIFRGAVASVVLLSAAACGVEAAEVRGRALEVPAGDAGAAAAADLRFGLGLLDVWCGRDPAANVVFSPAGLASGLGMAALGARGTTAAEMAKVLGWPGEPLGRLKARAAALRGLPGVRVSDQVWADEGLRAEPDYLDRVATGYGAGVKLLPLRQDPEGSREAVNDAISEDTGGLVEDLIPEGALKDVGWLLTDAVHLKADWQRPFEKKDTARGEFTTASGTKIQARYLNRTGDFGYARHGGWTGVRLAYEGGRLGLLALLPDGDGRACPKPDAETVEAFGTRTGGTRLALSLPKVDLSAKRQVNDLLAEAGMATAFSDRADFTGISPKAASISAVRHAAALRVDEKGTEAAAATSVEVGVTAVAPEEVREVSFDKPYLLLLQDLRTGEPLFLARVADPGMKG